MSIPDLTQLREALPPRARRNLYASFLVVAVAISAIQVGYAAVPDVSSPVWLRVASAVALFLGTPFASIALANIPSAPDARRALDADGDGVPDIAG